MSTSEHEAKGTPAPAAVEGSAADRPGAGPPGRPSLGWTELGFAVVAYLGLTVAAFYLVGMPTADGGNTTGFLLAGVVVTLLAVGGALALRVRRPSAIGLRATTWRWLLAGVGVGLLVRILGIGLIIAYMAITGDLSNPQDFLAGASGGGGGTNFLLLLLLGAVLIPFAEELLFRGIGYGALRRYGVWIPLVVTSVLFGIAHGVNVVLPVAVLLGVCNALLYERSGSIWPAVLSHAVNNALVFGAAALLMSA